MKELLIRADASVEIGTGHLMRCLALAQAWQAEGGKATFAVAMEASVAATRIASENIGIVRIISQPGGAGDAAETIEAACGLGAKWVVVDGYHFDDGYQRLIHEAELRCLVLDDFGHASRYWADIILNQNINADENLYARRESHTRLLLGSSYVLLRREFLKWREWRHPVAPLGRHFLVTIGGSDPGNVTPTIIQALSAAKVQGLETVVAVGADNPHLDQAVMTAEASHHPVDVRKNVQDIAKLMAWADVGVIGAGSTLWEMLFMGCPAVCLSRTPLQDTLFRDMERKNLVTYLGSERNADPVSITGVVESLASAEETRRRASLTGRSLVDGRGCERVLHAMSEVTPDIAGVRCENPLHLPQS